ncbi:uncharacterized protein OCT59_028014 [Rhizophagus irregularis]|uniref:uncharacterized protein n=1 Tax=Rhizophagus irregularis TaxID=588596 RepID=UPI00331FEE8F|nr:hypothetical protein OCT59_028014 [Rhizophagus irregularis]
MPPESFSRLSTNYEYPFIFYLINFNMTEIEVVAIFGVGDYVWVPWSIIINSISIKVKNELSRKIRRNRNDIIIQICLYFSMLVLTGYDD